MVARLVDSALGEGVPPKAGSFSLRGYLGLIRFSHTLFALPWALAGLFLGSGGWPEPRVLLWVMVAMVGARTAAMSFNRLADRHLDATNPRTAGRESVTGAVGPRVLGVATVLGLALLVVAAYVLNPLCGLLSWPTAAVVIGYSYTKRFTALCHVALGLALGISPVGAYLAARGAFDAASMGSVAMGFAVLAWTAGFDILYACQDVDHDRREGLASIPARLGVRRSLIVARIAHGLVPLALAAAAVLAGLGAVFIAGVIVVTGLLLWEHRLVRADDLSRVGVAFFQMNVAIAVVVMIATLVDLLVERGGAA